MSSTMFGLKSAVIWLCNRDSIAWFEQMDGMHHIVIDMKLKDGERISLKGLDFLDIVERAKVIEKRRKVTK